MSGAVIVLIAVVGARFLVPLLIPRYPLPGILAALLLDAVDQSIFQAFGQDPPGYQGYDKAMDMYYLAIAYLATIRNWSSGPAERVARFLYFYRLAGVLAYEITDWRPLLLIFPNTFEYFFIAYELIRLHRDPRRLGRRFWIALAAAIWIIVKLPQEWWIHIAGLDLTDVAGAYPLATASAVIAVAGAAALATKAVRPRLPAPQPSWRVRADRLPRAVDTADERDEWIAAHRRVLSFDTLEKVLLVGLLSVVFGHVLPGRQSSDAELFVGVAVFVVLNTAITLWTARHSYGIESAIGAFAARAGLNVGLVFVAGWLLGPGDLHVANTLFFVLLLSLLTLLDDRFRPAQEVRLAKA